jgi:2'-5' RNA ligase
MRLFVAIELSDSVRSVVKAVQDGLHPSCDGVRWVPAHQVHVTAKFLGEVPDAKVPDVSNAVARAATKAASFAMQVAGCGCFPPRGPVRIVWVGLREESGALMRCVDTVEDELANIGFAKERRPFSPHVTVGRVRDDRSHGGIRSAVEDFTFDSVEQSVSSITLMSSVLSPKGPTYTAVSKTNLG